MKSDLNKTNRPEKILLFMFEFASGGRAKIRYEDIVVGLFKKYPQDFQLKGYPEYPDSGDLIHKPLYNFKKKGYINAENKIFSLTERGAEFAQTLSSKNVATENFGDRLSRSIETEIIRTKNLEGFSLFLDGKKDKLSDNDLYNYLGVTVRTQKNAFIGRFETMNAVVTELRKQEKNDLYKSILNYHEFLISKFANIIEFFKKN